MVQEATLQVFFELLSHERRQLTARCLDRLQETRVMLGDDGIENRPFRTVAAVGRC
jgi:hypothetical protein